VLTFHVPLRQSLPLCFVAVFVCSLFTILSVQSLPTATAAQTDHSGDGVCAYGYKPCDSSDDCFEENTTCLVLRVLDIDQGNQSFCVPGIISENDANGKLQNSFFVSLRCCVFVVVLFVFFFV
jgi:hypothetical protein